MSAGSSTQARTGHDLFAPIHLTPLVAIAIATAMMLQSMRVFTSYMVFVIDQANRVEIALVLFPTFGAIALGGLLMRLFGVRSTLLMAAVLFGTSRLGFQFWELPEARLALGAAAMSTWGWFMLAVLRSWRDVAALGVAFGLGLDLTIRIALMSRDLPWNPSLIDHLFTLLLVALLTTGSFAIWRSMELRSLPISSRSAVSLAAIGPGLAVYHVVTGNLGMAQEATDLAFPEAAILLALGTAIGVRFTLFAGELLSSPPGARVNTGPLFVAIGLALGLFLIGQGGILAVPGMIIAPAAFKVLITFATAGRELPAELTPSLTWLTLAFTAGLLAKVGLLFLYFMYSGQPVILGIIAGLFVLLTIPAGVPAISRPVNQPRQVILGAGALAAALAIVSGYQLLTWSSPEPVAASDGEFTVMTYNIQNGFDLENRWDLESIARTIDAEDPDVVVIQEIGRGWLVLNSVDQVTLLSQRLDMPYIYGKNSHDGLWGNAIFSRLPIEEASTTQYSLTHNLMRGAVEVAVQTEFGTVWIYGTHLDNPGDADEVRFTQGSELLEKWDGKLPAMILGDLNVDPDDPLMGEFAEAGFRDLGRELPPGAFTSPGGRRIDYILATDEVEVVDIHITEVWTSDHLPVIATLRIAD